jgi:hypothetical protein
VLNSARRLGSQARSSRRSALTVRRAKALLQTILKAAHVYRDSRIELEFRA